MADLTLHVYLHRKSYDPVTRINGVYNHHHADQLLELLQKELKCQGDVVIKHDLGGDLDHWPIELNGDLLFQALPVLLNSPLCEQCTILKLE